MYFKTDCEFYSLGECDFNKRKTTKNTRVEAPCTGGTTNTTIHEARAILTGIAKVLQGQAEIKKLLTQKEK